MTTADRIKNRRMELGLTQEDLAKKMNLSDRSSVTRIEKSGNNVSFKQICKVADSLDCTVAYLMGMTNDPHQSAIIEPKNQQTTIITTLPQTTLEKIRGVPPKTVTITAPKNMLQKAAYELTTEHKQKDLAKVEKIEMIDAGQRIRSGPPKKRIPKPILNEREKLIKKIMDLPDDLIDEVSTFIDFQISKLEGGD